MAFLLGPPDQDEIEKEHYTARTHYDWLHWLHDADPTCQLAIVSLDTLRQQYPQWQPREYPDSTHWHGTVEETQLERPWSVEQLLARPAKDWVNGLLEFQGTGFFGSGRSGLLNVVSEAVKQHFGWGHALAES